jgi:CheY-like chemotaxis protein
MPLNGKSRGEHRRRVLIVDDDPYATHILGRLLRRHEYVAVEENDPTRAAHIACRFQPDIVLLDFHMPWKDGHEVAADFASDKSLRHIPIIFMTADPSIGDRSPETIPILLKPFSIDDLLACLKQAVSKTFEMLPDTEEERFPTSLRS